MFTLRRYLHDNTMKAITVNDLFPGAEDGDEVWACNHARTARGAAQVHARVTCQPIAVVRERKVAYIMQPDGTTRPPEGAVAPPRAACTRDNGRPCFCMPCRLERKAAR